MQLRATLTLLVLAASSAVAQDLSKLPQCASGPALNALQSTGCGTDIPCVCRDKNFLTSLQPIIHKDCSPSDEKKAIEFAQSLCESAGIAIDTSSSAPATTNAPTATSAHVATTKDASEASEATQSASIPLGPGPEITSSVLSAASVASTGTASEASTAAASEASGSSEASGTVASAATTAGSSPPVSTGAAMKLGMDGGLSVALGAIVAAMAL